MNELREILYRLRKGESQREIARALHLSRNTVRKYLTLAGEKGLLDPARPLPEGQELKEAMKRKIRPGKDKEREERIALFTGSLYQDSAIRAFSAEVSGLRGPLSNLNPQEPIKQRGLSDLIRLMPDKVVVEMSPPFKVAKLLKRLEGAQIAKAANASGQAHH